MAAARAPVRCPSRHRPPATSYRSPIPVAPSPQAPRGHCGACFVDVWLCCRRVVSQHRSHRRLEILTSQEETIGWSKEHNLNGLLSGEQVFHPTL
ncbi:hypothetical protein BRADI_3g11596v3 [Brachypodium distachyon]|uniref:Uncharacterized protein n=1 Tax=Brachypodium distachyon TaxID=15368 RepID=A0A2K2CWQ1_BRADI|nr:hypothetical protein BRADI_3g11596v3 [Brachypodium distachyon]